MKKDEPKTQLKFLTHVERSSALCYKSYFTKVNFLTPNRELISEPQHRLFRR
jgi:hypothetical protein